MTTADTALVETRPGTVFPPAGVGVVVFDVVGTLVEPSPSVAVAYQQAALRHGLTVNAAVIQERFKAAWQRQEMVDAAAVPAFATSRGREAERWHAIVDDVFGGEAVSGAIFADLWEHFGRVEAWQPLVHVGAACVCFVGDRLAEARAGILSLGRAAARLRAGRGAARRRRSGA